MLKHICGLDSSIQRRSSVCCKRPSCAVLDDSEGERLVSVMKGKRVLLHQSHGVICCGRGRLTVCP